MTQIDRAASAEDRSRFFWWLAEWFLNPPSRDTLASLPATMEAEPPADAMDSAWLALANAVPNMETDSLNELGSEFTRLFSGVQESLGPPPPFESVWREDRLIGESTAQVVAAYAKSGFADIAPEAGPQDHVAVELRFIALLALREAEAWQSDDRAVAHQRLIQQSDFLKQHLAVWAPRWADAIIQQARLPLFAALAGLLKAGLDQAALELVELSRAAP
jgi:TorA maturation chaperone TorD